MPNAEVRYFDSPTAGSWRAANRDPVRCDAPLTEPLSLPHGRGIRRATVGIVGHDLP